MQTIYINDTSVRVRRAPAPRLPPLRATLAGLDFGRSETTITIRVQSADTMRALRAVGIRIG